MDTPFWPREASLMGRAEPCNARVVAVESRSGELRATTQWMAMHEEIAFGGDVIEHDVIALDGRRLRVAERGVRDGLPVLVHHGTPGSSLMYQPDVDQARDQGVRLISYDRPGYGGSDRLPGRAIGDCAKDVRAIAGALGIDRLAVGRVSGGGPHALAGAGLLPGLGAA